MVVAWRKKKNSPTARNPTKIAEAVTESARASAAVTKPETPTAPVSATEATAIIGIISETGSPSSEMQKAVSKMLKLLSSRMRLQIPVNNLNVRAGEGVDEAVSDSRKRLRRKQRTIPSLTSRPIIARIASRIPIEGDLPTSAMKGDDAVNDAA